MALESGPKKPASIKRVFEGKKEYKKVNESKNVNRNHLKLPCFRLSDHLENLEREHFKQFFIYEEEEDNNILDE